MRLWCFESKCVRQRCWEFGFYWYFWCSSSDLLRPRWQSVVKGIHHLGSTKKTKWHFRRLMANAIKNFHFVFSTLPLVTIIRAYICPVGSIWPFCHHGYHGRLPYVHSGLYTCIMNYDGDHNDSDFWATTTGYHVYTLTSHTWRLASLTEVTLYDDL